jgi:NADH-quinone oxidoreductase subunit H
LPEAEQELIGGYHTEYAGMKLLLFLIAEFLHMITASFLIVVLFFGGWHLWGVTGHENDVTWSTALLRIAAFAIKVVLVILFFMLIRWSWPRFRFDQLMSLAWKVMLPLGLVNLLTMAVLVEMREQGVAVLQNMWTVVAVSWIVTLVAWIAAGILAPLASDNWPRRAPSALDPERRLSA